MRSSIVVFMGLALLFSTGFGTAWGADFVLTGREHLDVTSSYTKGVLWDSSTVNMKQQGNVDELHANNTSSVTISGGRLGRGETRDASKVSISGGNHTAMSTYDTSKVAISGGSVGRIDAHNTSSVTASDGRLDGAETHDASKLSISGGNYSMARVVAYGTSSMTISGGKFARVEAYNTSSVTISGGTVEGVSTSGSSSISISGGSIGTLYDTGEKSRITLYGYDFRATGGLKLDGDIVLGEGVLTGKWADGTRWTITIGRHSSQAKILIKETKKTEKQRQDEEKTEKQRQDEKKAADAKAEQQRQEQEAILANLARDDEKNIEAAKARVKEEAGAKEREARRWRVWTVNGKQVEARFQKGISKTVYLLDREGNEITVPARSLSSADWEWIRSGVWK
jgi:hypothetical protein